MECFGTTDFDNISRLITSAIIISGLHCIGILACALFSARQFMISNSVIVQYREHCGNSSLFCTVMNFLIPLYDCVFDADVEIIEVRRISIDEFEKHHL